MPQNIPIDRILDTSSLRLEEDTPITDALIQLTRSGIGSALINSQDQWFCLSSKTLKHLTEQGKGSLKLLDILVLIPPLKMTNSVNIWELLRVMRSYRVDCLTVVDGARQAIGVIMLEQVLKFLEQVAKPRVAGGWYEYITDTTSEGVFIVDLDLVLLFVNTKLSTLLGYATGMMEGRNLNEFLVVAEQNEQQVETERHFRFQAQDGSDVWAIVVATPLFDENGNNIGTLGRISNITDRVTKERKEKRKLTALEIANEGIAVLNNRGEFIYANSSFCHLLHKEQQELIETNWWAIYGDYRRTPIEVELQQTGKWQGEFFYHDRYLEVSLSNGDEDIICICRDVTDRYQAQQALKESEERYRLLADYASDVIACCSIQGKYHYLSPACIQVLGYSAAEMLNHIFFDYIHPEDRVRVHLAYQVMLDKLDSNRFVYRFCRKDGSYIWIETTARVKRYADTNAPMEIITVSRDVTESMETEAELTRSREELKLALEATNDSLWDWNIVTGEGFTSPNWFKMMGYKESEVVTHIDTFFELLHPEDKERVLQALDDHFQNKTDHYATQLRLRDANGEYKWFFAKGRVVERNQEGKPLRMLGAHSDISELKRMEDALKKQYQRALILEQIMIHIRSSLDFEAVLVKTVQELEKNFHQNCALVTFIHNQQLIYTTNDRLQNLNINLLPASIGETDTVTIVNPQAIDLDAVSDLAVVRTSYQNQQNGLIILGSWEHSFVWQKEDIELLADVAQQVGIAIAQAQLLREAQVHSELAKPAGRAKRSFLAPMSHEIRTPMNGIIGMAELLSHSELNEQQQELAQTILQSSNTLLTILNDILDFSKIEAGKMTLERQSFPLDTTIEDILALMTPLCYEKNLEIIYDFDPGLPTTIVGDVTRLRQVIVNLLSNAIKFCHDGEVIVGVSRWQGSNLLIAIEDTGIGIDPQKMTDLFLPFSQLDPSTTRNYGGTGLGLAISKFLVELMEGYIWVESNDCISGTPPQNWHYQRSLGRGSSFYVLLPIVSEEGQNTAVPSDQIPKRVLVIEPNPKLREIMQKWLVSWGMTVELQSDMSTARSLLQQNSFDVILVDDLFPPEEIMGCVAAVDVPVLVMQNPSREPFPGVITLPKPLKPQACRQLLESLLMPQFSVLPPVPPESTPPPSLRVLLVEDNPVNQKVAKRLLQKLGYEPGVAVNGIEALTLLEACPYDVILMDVQMPEMDGLTATQKIRTEHRHQPYIIAMTANAMRGDREICLEAGMDDYLSKPITLESLEMAIRKVKVK
ncbi:MAG: PAS domain S-box protein [Cyanobacteria bacterium KgW148]|nr:PAS domain S-box protein [Cyanobacteria bacterium KgW148]